MHSLFFHWKFIIKIMWKILFNYLNASLSVTSLRIEENFFKKKYAQKKHFVLENLNNYGEEINSTPQDRIDNIDLCRCACECKPVATFGESFCLLLRSKSRRAMGASRHSNSIEDTCQILLEILNAMKFLKLRPIKS